MRFDYKSANIVKGSSQSSMTNIFKKTFSKHCSLKTNEKNIIILF